MNKTLALIGVGNWGKNLARNFHALHCLHTICDTRTEILTQLRNQYSDVGFTTNFQEVLKNSEIKQVAIASPAALHYSLAKQALLAGKDVFVEKPLCLHTHEGEELIALAAKNHQILMVGHLLQYHPCVLHLHEMIRQG